MMTATRVIATREEIENTDIGRLVSMLFLPAKRQHRGFIALLVEADKAVGAASKKLAA
jgi:hypothetical protein